ncbi:hypothetical protein Tco_1055422 [Tanacetum coccineum]|uniref:Zinc finger, CCHC-type n=1 Tax=Tanacetum coccineum TaxID=301880 RepID=A0ABQ5GZL7_9ASTR
MTTSSANNSVFRGFFEKQKLIGPNFIDWYRQLRIVLSIEDKLNYLEQQLPPAPVALAGQQVAPEILATHTTWELKALFAQQAEYELLQTMREFHSCKQEEGQSVSSYNYNMHSMGKTINELHAMLKLHEQTLPKNNAPALHAIRAGHWKRNCPQYLAELLKNKKLSQGASGSGIFTIELYTFPNKSWVYDTGCGTHICNTTQGLRGSRKLKPVNTSSTDSQMHNNIMAAGSKDRPPMLGPGRYSQWRSRFLRYIDTKNNGEGLKKCILNGPYVPTSVLIQAVPAAEGRPAVQQHTAIETVLNMTPENKEHFQSEKEAIFLLLTGIGDEIYSTVDACNTANEMWIAIERLQQGESLNVQDVKTNLFWEFGKFTSRDGESMESYYSRFYKLMNELTRNNLQVTLLLTSANNYYPTPKPQRTNANIPTRPSASTKNIKAKSIKPNQCWGLKETVGSLVVQQTGYSGFKTARDFGHYAKECRKPKRVKDYSYHNEKMMMCKQAKQGIPLQAEQSECGYRTLMKRLMKQNWKAHTFHVKSSEECTDERVALANLIANLTLDTEENKTILKQLKKANASLTQELEECKTNLDESSRALGEATCNTPKMGRSGIWVGECYFIDQQHEIRERPLYESFKIDTLD